MVTGSERSISFPPPMIHALLAGTQTQTRRIVKLPAKHGKIHVDPGGSIFGSGPYLKVGTVADRDNVTMHPRIYCPYGYAGDRLWVRETHATFHVGEGMDRPVPECVAYRATFADGAFDYVNTRGEVLRLKVTKWTPASRMPRWASRITLEITSVRAEPLHAITEGDAWAEGIESFDGVADDADVCRRAKAMGCSYEDALPTFAALWDSINGKKAPWRTNPWVWVVAFRRVAQGSAGRPDASVVAVADSKHVTADPPFKQCASCGYTIRPMVGCVCGL